MHTQILGIHPGSVTKKSTHWNEAVVTATNVGATSQRLVGLQERINSSVTYATALFVW